MTNDIKLHTRVTHPRHSEGVVVGQSWIGVQTQYPVELPGLVEAAKNLGHAPDTCTVRFGPEDGPGLVTSVLVEQLQPAPAA